MSQREPIAIVRLASMFPGALSAEEFWKNVQAGHDAVREVPAGRWEVAPDDILDAAPGNPDRSYARRGGFVEGFKFDPSGYALDAALLNDLDPLFQWVLHTGKQVLDGAILNRERTGVVLANLALPSDAFAQLGRVGWRELLRSALGPNKDAIGMPESRRHPANHFQAALPAGLLARAFNLQGGTLALDAACASSLYAIKLACDALQEGRVDAMIAGGVARTDHLCLSVGFSQLRAISRAGRSRPFDQAADGLIPGEGVGLFLLKRLSDAQQNRDDIVGVIRAVGLSNDGKGRGVLMPMSEGQIRAMRAAYAESGIDPTSVGLIECHATGTPVGDAAEVQTLKAVWGDKAAPGSTAIGSAKSMIGHLLTAAGSAGLVKAVHALRDHKLPPTINFEKPQPGMKFEGSPFFVNTTLRNWDAPKSGPRRAGVNAFGFGGCNAHLIVEEAPAKGSAVARVSTKPNREPLAVVAMASRFGVAPNVDAYREILFEGRNALTAPPEGRWFGLEKNPDVMRPLPGSYMTGLQVEDPLKLRIPPAEIDRMLPQQLLALLVAEDMMQHAPKLGDKNRVGVAVGFSMESDAGDYAFRWSAQRDASKKDDATKAWLNTVTDKATRKITAEPVLGFLANLIANRISSRFDLGGPSLAVSSEDASALKCVELAANALRRREVDAMIVGGVDLPGDIRTLWLTDHLQGWSKGELRVFDKRADGSLPGEGAGLVVLKRLSDAERDGDTVLAVLEGIGSGHDGGQGEIGKPSQHGHALALHRAYDDAGVAPKQVGLLMAHGSGRPAEDTAEIRALHQVFGTSTEPRSALSFTKTAVGHTGAASGIASFIGAVLALHHRALPPVKGVDDPLDGDTWKGSPFYAPRKARPWLADDSESPRRAGVSAMSVDGNHVHAVLREGATSKLSALGSAVESLFIFNGSSRQDIANELTRFKEQARGGDLERLALARASKHERGAHPMTLSIVAADLKDLDAKIEKALNHVRGDVERVDDIHGIYFSSKPLKRRGNVAFVFPGAGNAYAGMAREIVLRYPELVADFAGKTVAPRSRSMERWVHPRQLVVKRASRAEELRTPQEMIWGAGYYTQMLSDAIRRRMGVRPEAAIGYSLGESSGLFALDAWNSIDELHERLSTWPLFTTELSGPMNGILRAWKKKGVDVEQYKGKPFWMTYMLVTAPENVLPHLKDEPLVHLAIINAPDECVISGEAQACKRVIEKVKCSAHVTPFDVAVHVPEVEEVVDEYRKIHTLPTKTPEGVTYYSSGTGVPYEVTTENAAQSIVDQAVRMVDFPALVRRAYDDGVRIFLEVGPRGSCTRWIDKILDGREYLAIASDRKGRSELVNLLHVAGALAAQGVDVDLQNLYGSQQSVPVVTNKPGARTYETAHTLQLPAPPPPSTEKKAPVAAAPVVKPGAPVPPPRPPSTSKPIQVPRSVSLPPPPPPPRVAPPGAPRATMAPVAAPLPPPRQEDLTPAEPFWTPVETPMPNVTVNVQHVEGQQENPAYQDAVSQLVATFQQTFTTVAESHRQFIEQSRMANDALMRMIALAESVNGLALPPAQSNGNGNGHHTQAYGPAQSVVAPSWTPPYRELRGNNMHPRKNPKVVTYEETLTKPFNLPARPYSGPLVWDYEACRKLAGGKLGDVFGPAFAEVDTYPVRVRLPNPPLLLCHRITELNAVPHSMKGGTLSTESDHREDEYFIHRGYVPCGITVESGQADLTLVAYNGIDQIVKGEKRYRLLDCELTFLDMLPRHSDTLHYDIKILRFVEQHGTHLFFFQYDLTVDGRPILQMRNGCAGFFSQAALADSMGVVLPPSHKLKARPPKGELKQALSKKRALSDAEFQALADGDMVTALGPEFAVTRSHPQPLTIANGLMKIINRVVNVDPNGGACGLGVLEAEQDVFPEAWYFPCHFQEDEVMAGSLMYETCVQALQTFMLHLGHGNDFPNGTFHPLPNQTAKVKCRGQVLPHHKKVTYKIDIIERGTEPTPYAIAEANCFVDGKHIVWAQNLTLRIVDNTLAITPSPQGKAGEGSAPSTPSRPVVTAAPPSKPALYSKEQIIAHGLGTPSELWGPEYKIFDSGRRMARLPNGPYLLLDRVTEAKYPPKKLEAGNVLVGEYDVPSQEWYFEKNQYPTMPFSVLLEVFLQPCGFMASYMGSDLRCNQDRKFRNLGGKATQYMEVTPGCGTLVTKATLTKFSEYGDMLVVNYDVETTLNGQKVMDGSSYFGFFTEEALAAQKGLNGKMPPRLTSRMPRPINVAAGEVIKPGVPFPSRPVLMMDTIVDINPAGGRHGKGYARAEKPVNPDEWFFKAHFYQDPVQPGSLGVDGLLQLLMAYMTATEPNTQGMRFEPVMLGRGWEWTYRGQVIQKNKLVTMEVEILERVGGESPYVVADAFLSVDGLAIYRLDGVAMRMVRA